VKRRLVILAAVLVCSSLGVLAQRAVVKPDPPNNCEDCAEWNAAQAPFKLFGNSYYVGMAGLSSVLVTSDAGLILLDAALPQSAAPIDEHIRALGFKTEDVKFILSSHAHYDHAGGIAALQRATGATVVASAAGAKALETGMPTPDDPQVGYGKSMLFTRVQKVKVVADGEAVRLGPLAITAHYTPGHTPGAVTWSWQSCEGAKCVNLVYADSLSAVSAPGFKFTSDPPRVEQFRKSIATLEALPCDILVTVHPGFVQLPKKLAARKDPDDTAPFIDSGACKAFAANVRKMLDGRIAEETKK
jgi:metallo-beta-lactamase class B